jgi:hypothetical protein
MNNIFKQNGVKVEHADLSIALDVIVFLRILEAHNAQ